MECTIQSLKINYEKYGEGTPVIMLHGFAVDNRLMKGCMEPVFSNNMNFKRIYPDLPGMGLSEGRDTINCADEILSILCDFIDNIIPGEDFILAGESFGGYLSRGIKSRMPDRVQGILLICPTIIPQRELRTLPVHKIVERNETFLATLPEKTREKFIKSTVILTEGVYNRYRDEVVAGIKLSDKNLLRRVRENFALSIDVDNNSFDKPVIFIVGRQDSVVGYYDAFNILEKYPRGDFFIVDGAGHNLQIEQSQIFTKLAKNWFESNFIYKKPAN